MYNPQKTRIAGVLIFALAVLLNGCGGGSTTPMTNDDGTTADPAPPTFVRSFGQSSPDVFAGITSDANGELWLAGNFQGTAPGASTAVADQPWLGNLDGIGDLTWQLSPTDQRGRTRIDWKHGEATPDDGALFVGEAETLEGRNVIVQRHNPDGDVIWEVQLDGTSRWAQSGLTFLPAEPASDEYVVGVHGEPDIGRWIVTHSEADGVDVRNQSVFGAPSVFVWFVTATGAVNPDGPFPFGTRNPEPKDSESEVADAVATRVAGSTIYRNLDGDPADMRLGVLLHAVNPSGSVSNIAWVGLRRNATGELEGVPERFGAETDANDDYQYGSLLEPFVGTFGGSRTLYSEFLHLRKPRPSEPDAPYQVVRYDSRGDAIWGREFANDAFTEVNDLTWTQTLRVNASTNTQEYTTTLWAAGSAMRDGEKVPSVWRLSQDGQMVAQCFPPRVVGFRVASTVVAVEAGDGGLRLLLAAQDELSDEPTVREINIDTDCNRQGDIRRYDADTNVLRGVLDRLPSQPQFSTRNSVDGSGTETVVDIRSGRTIYRFDRTAQALAVTLDSLNGDPTDIIPTGIAARKTEVGAGLVVLTGSEGQIQGFDDSGAPQFNINFSNFGAQQLTSPVIDRANQVWMAGEEGGTPLIRLGNNRALEEINLLNCFWRADDVITSDTYCPLDIMSIDDGSVASGWVHMIGRGRVSEGVDEPTYRYFKLSFDENFPQLFQIRYLPDGQDDLVFSNEEFSGGRLFMDLDTLDSDADGDTLINVMQVQPEPTPRDVRLARRGVTVQLQHYGATDATRWAINTRGLSLQDAVLAHDGGVVMLLVATLDAHSLSSANAGTIGIQRNIALVKLTAEGATQWMRVYGTAGDELPTQLIRTVDGYAIAAMSDGVDVVTPASQDLLVIKTGIDGRIASDADGEDFCQAVLLTENGDFANTQLRRSAVDALRVDLPAWTADSRGLQVTPLTTTTVPTATAVLDSTTSARQCFGSATNIQEDPFTTTQNAEISVVIVGNGSVSVRAGNTLDTLCTDDCTNNVAVGSQVTLEPTPAAGWVFSDWSGDAACGSVAPIPTFVAVEGVTQCFASFVLDAQPPVARINLTPPGGFDTTTAIEFDGSASSDSDGSIVSYSWDFDSDGSEDATGERVTRTFDSAGNYTTTLTVTDDSGLTGQQVRMFNVVAALSAPPTAAFTVSPGGPTTLGTVLTLDATTSSDDVGIQTWSWDIGDDGSVDATGEVVMVTPPVAGSIPIRLRVVDADGQIDETVQTVVVNAATGVEFTLLVTINGPGGVDVAPLGLSLPDSSCDGNECFIFGIAAGTQLTLDAFGFTPSVFDGWAPEDCDAINADACVLTMNADRSVTASFQ
ncbi:MAG: PKD domain-containing protein [Pseudomonadota bacterium]